MSRSFLLCVAFCAPLNAQKITRLNAPLPSTTMGEVEPGFTYTASGSRVVYRADQNTLGRIELFSRPSDGSGESVRLNPANPAHHQVGSFKMTPDGTRVIFEFGELTLFGALPTYWIAPLDGSSPAQLLLQPPTLREFEITADSQYLVYSVGGADDTLRGLYSLPLDGSSPPARISPFMAYPRSISYFELDPGGQWLVYRADQNTTDVDELFGAPVDGSQPAVRLNSPLVHPTQVLDFQVAPAGQRVVYSVYEAPGRHVYSAPLDGGEGPTQLTDPNLTLGDLKEFTISPDGQTVVVVADLRSYNISELFSIPIDGSAPARQLFLSPGTGREVWFAKISPDGTRAVFLGDTQQDGNYRLHSVPLAGGRVELLNTPVGSDGSVGLWLTTPFVISPDSSRVVYLATQPQAGIIGLYAATLAGDSNQRVSVGIPENHWIPEFSITPDSQQVAYRWQEWPAETSSLWAAPITGGASQNLADPSGIPQMVTSPTGDRVAWLEEEGQGRGLYTRPLDASQGATPLHDGLPSLTVGDIESFQVSPDETWVVYLGDQETDQQQELYSTPFEGGPIHKLNLPLEEYGNVQTYKISSDSQWVVFTADPGLDHGSMLYSAPIDGSSPTIRLSQAMSPANGVVGATDDEAWANGVSISADSQWVVYVADAFVNNRDEIFSVSIDGSTAPKKLNGLLPAGASVRPHFRLSADSTTVVYMADQVLYGREELFGVSIDGSSSAIQLNTTPVAGGDVQRYFHITGDSQRLVYRADQDVNNREELYSVPLDGSLPAIKLNGSLPSGGEVLGFDVSPDGQNAVFWGYLANSNILDLFAAPTDGQGMPVLLNVPLSPGGSASLETFTPDGQDLLYRVTEPGLTSLLRVPITGGASTSLLSASQIQAPILAMDGRQIVTALPVPAGQPRLHILPSDGSAAPTPIPGTADAGVPQVSRHSRRLGFYSGSSQVRSLDRITGANLRINRPLAAGGQVEGFWMSRRGKRFVYRAKDSDTGAVKLFSSEILHGVGAE